MLINLPVQVYQRRKKVPHEDGGDGYTTVPDGEEVVQLVAEIDVDRLAQALGPRAWRSKRGIAQLQGGAVTVRIKR